jgi:hypothetical protein
MSLGPAIQSPRTCPHCGAAVPSSAGLRKDCPVCHADLSAPGDPGKAVVEGMLDVLGGITGSPFTGEKRGR